AAVCRAPERHRSPPADELPRTHVRRRRCQRRAAGPDRPFGAVPMMMRVAILAIVVLLTGVGGGLAASRCPSTKAGQARFPTIAWVSTTCRTDANGLVGHQEIYVQRGDRPPTVVSQLDVGLVPDPVGLCRTFGQFKNGVLSPLAGAYVSL